MRAVMTSALLLCLCHTTPALAEILERDWKTPGDGLLTYDTVNGREWLELTESLLGRFGGITTQEIVDNAISELEPGGLFEGFTWASPDAVRDFAVSAGVDVTTQEYATNIDPVRSVLELLGTTVSGSPRFALGTLNDRQLAVFEYQSEQPQYARLQISPGLVGDLDRPAYTGLMLYRKAIPEPSAGLLAAVGALGLLVRGRARKKPRRLTRWRIRAPRMLLAFLLTAALATPASAEILQRDWKAPGDGLLTYDTVNGREWLELTESVLTNFEGHSYQEHLDNAVAELEPGGLFEEFTWASPDDVRAFAVSAGIDRHTQDYDTNGEAVMTVLDLLGITVFDAPRFTIGFVDDRQLAVFEYQSNPTPIARLRIAPGLGGDIERPPYIGLMLYREAIPEPPAGLLLAAALFGLSAIRWMHSRRRLPIAGRWLGCVPLLVIAASPASAAVLERDWRERSDGLLTYDTVNQREWLELTESVLTSFEGSTGEELLEDAVAELQPGGLFDEFKWASPDDVRDFAVSAGIDVTTQDYDTNIDPVMAIFEFLGITVPSIPRFTLGTLNDRQLAVFEYQSEQPQYARLQISPGLVGDLDRPAYTGLMLYRDTIPEPSAGLLAAAGAFGLLIHGRARKKPRRLTRWCIQSPRLLLAFLLTAALVTPASAGILERDWKAPGDGLLTYDTVNHREWLELTESILKDFEGNTYQEHLENAVAELEPGGLFEGFTWAAPVDAQDFAVSAGIDLSTQDYDTNGEAVIRVLTLLGATVFDIPQFSFGVLNDYQFAVFDYHPVGNSYARMEIRPLLGGDLARTPYIGVMLYRRTIPEPPAALLAAMAVLLSLPATGLLRTSDRAP